MVTRATTQTRSSPKKFTSWSFSRYMDYKGCPAKAKYKHLDKLAEPGNAAMERGSAIHTLAEQYTNGLIKRIPKELALFKEEFKDLKGQRVKVVEENWAWTQGFATETAWDNWTGAWVRVKLDVAFVDVDRNILVPIDHKTGKCRPQKQLEYEDQLQLYGLSGLLRFPDVAGVAPKLWYLDEGVIWPDPAEEEIVYPRKDLEKLKKIWIKNVTPMLNDTSFKPKPGDACRFCHYKAANGGPCKY